MKQLFEATARAARGGSVLFAAGAAVLSLVVVACGDDDIDPGDPSALATNDAGSLVDSGNGTTIDASDTSTVEDAGTDANDGAVAETAAQRCTTTATNPTTATAIELCAPAEGTVQHFTLVGVQATAGHAYAAIELGFDTAPTNPQAALVAGQVRVLLYGGGPPPPALVQADFGTTSETVSTTAPFVNTLSTICFDISDGSADAPPKLTLWVDGQNDASCADRSTLTAESASGSTKTWPNGAVIKNKKVYFSAAAGLPGPVITVSSVPAL